MPCFVLTSLAVSAYSIGDILKHIFFRILKLEMWRGHLVGRDFYSDEYGIQYPLAMLAATVLIAANMMFTFITMIQEMVVMCHMPIEDDALGRSHYRFRVKVELAQYAGLQGHGRKTWLHKRDTHGHTIALLSDLPTSGLQCF